MAKKKKFFEANRNEKGVSGIVYILQIRLEDRDLVKIGLTTRLKIEDRVGEILVGIFHQYRHFPYCYPKRFQRTTDIYEKEAALHYHFSECRYKPFSFFGGCTEFFEIADEEYLLEMYARCLAGEDIRKLDKYVPKVKQELSDGVL